MEKLAHKQQELVVYCHSLSALYIAGNPVFHSRTKHIGLYYHFVREVVEEGSVDMQKIHTNENLTDVMINPVIDKFTWIRSYYVL